jgi:hypothetical protein
MRDGGKETEREERREETEGKDGERGRGVRQKTKQ